MWRIVRERKARSRVPPDVQFPQFTPRRWRIVGASALGLASLLLIIALLLLSFGWTLLRRPLERRLSATFDRTVTIGRIARTDHAFFNATLVVDEVKVAQPKWAGPGAMIHIRRAQIQFPVLPLLAGRFRPQAAEIDGLRVALVRTDALHANWKGLPGGGSSGGSRPTLGRLIIRDGIVILKDTKRDHFLTARLAADESSFRLSGRGMLIGRPSAMTLAGPAATRPGKWPFRLTYRSAIANILLASVADHPLDIGHFGGAARAWGDDLQHLDLLVEAGLPGTVPVRSLTATIRHDRPDWNVPALAATVGRSDVTGHISITKRGERTVLDGTFVSNGLDFDDLANARGKRIAAAKRAAAPNRRLPDTAIDLSHLLKTDGKLDVTVRRLLFDKPSAFKSMRGTLTMDHGVLTAAPFVTGLESGTLSGKVVVTQTETATRLSLDLKIADGRIEDMASDPGVFSGALAGRFVLDGQGKTIRAAVGAADGRFAIVGRDGTLGRKTALLLGQDIGRGLFAKSGDTARLRCAIASFAVRNGKARPAPLLVDTSVARADAVGLVDLANERIDLSLTGAPKQASALRLSGPIRVTGQLFAPTVAAPLATSTKGILKSIGRALSGEKQPIAADADCAGLAAQALR